MTRTFLASLVLLGALVALPGCFLFGGGDSADGSGADGGTGGTVGDPCKSNASCKAPLICDSKTKTCQAMADRNEGEPCMLSAECKTGLYCTPLSVCGKSGLGKEGDSCGKEGDCETGLTCAVDGLYGKCVKAGKGTVGAMCTTPGDCLAGLSCKAKVCTVGSGVMPWPGGACDGTEDAVAKAYFKVPVASEAPSEDFYKLPFPNDIRKRDGKLSFAGHPHPGVQLLPIDVIDLYLRTAEKDMTAFGTNQAAYFRFSKRVDFDSLNAANAIEFIDITPGSPDYGRQMGLSYFATDNRLNYICPRYLVVSPPSGQPLRPKTTYAIILRDAILDRAEKKPFGRDTDFEAVMAAAPSGGADLQNAWTAYAPLRAYLAAKSVDPTPIITAAVFTTQDPFAVMAKMREAVRAAAAPAYEVKGFMKCDGVAKSPCDDGLTGDAHTRGCLGAHAEFDEYQAKVTLPIFQQGTAPYLNLADGGDIVVDGSGVPQVQRTEDVCMSLTVPKGTAPAGGWPVAVYGHGTGGTYRSQIDLDVATEFAKLGGGVATLSTDGVLHGDRKGGSMKASDDLVYNFLNPRSARDNFAQEAAEHMAKAKLLESWTQGGLSFDATKMIFVGHSQGSTSGALAVPFEPLYKTVVFGGHGAELRKSLLSKTKPVNIAGVVPVILTEYSDVDVNHPVINILQSYFEPVDPVNYARLLFSEPMPDAKPKNVLHVYGTMDTYSPEVTQQSFALACNLPAVTPIIDSFGLTMVAPPLTGNVTSGALMVTAVHAQWKPGDYDGHFIDTHNAMTVKAINGFVDTAVKNGTPTFSAP